MSARAGAGPKNEAGAREDLFVARTDGSQFRRLTDDAFRDRSPAWDQWNVRLRWEAAPSDYGQFSAELYMTNVENNDHIINLSVGAISELWPEQGNLHPPRLYGFTLGWSY